jgi:hypothetical protein
MSTQRKPSIVFVHGIWADGSDLIGFFGPFEARKLPRRSGCWLPRASL